MDTIGSIAGTGLLASPTSTLMNSRLDSMTSAGTAGAGLRDAIATLADGPGAEGNTGGMDARRSFAEILSIADRGPLATKPTAREAAEAFVAVALVQPMLAAARESSWAAPPFAPTQGEKQFGALMDAHVAREVTRAARFPLVERLARQMRGS